LHAPVVEVQLVLPALRAHGQRHQILPGAALRARGGLVQEERAAQRARGERLTREWLPREQRPQTLTLEVGRQRDARVLEQGREEIERRHTLAAVAGRDVARPDERERVAQAPLRA